MRVALDDAQQLVAEDQPPLARGRDAEEALGDLAVGPAHPDLERAHEDLPRLRDGIGDGDDLGGARPAGGRDERQHGQTGRRTAPSVAEPTAAR